LSTQFSSDLEDLREGDKVVWDAVVALIYPGKGVMDSLKLKRFKMD
jgi:hypothetical protein